MKRTTIFVPETLERDLQLYAKREQRPVAAVCREALTEYLASRRGTGGLPSFTGAFDSGRSDTAEQHEELLFANIDPHPTAAHYRPGRARRRSARRASTPRRRR